MHICEAKLSMHAVKLAHELWFGDPWDNSGSNMKVGKQYIKLPPSYFFLKVQSELQAPP